MAATAITPLVLTRNTFGTSVIAEFKAVASDGTNNVAYIDAEAYADQKILILIRNAHATTVKDAYVLKGNGIQKPASDLTAADIPAASASIIPIVVESGAYANTTGTYAGKIVVKGESTDIQVAAVILP